MLMGASRNDRRSDVRGDFCYTVRYKMIFLNEYELLRKKNFRPSRLNEKKLKNGASRSDNMVAGLMLNDEVVNFLIQMDEKLDRILSLISKDESYAGPYREGVGRNISASGLNIVIDQPAKRGQILHLSVILSKIPFVGIDAYGEIVRVNLEKELNKSMWQIAIKYLSLDEASREKIVAYIFQMQRKAIREGIIAVS